MSIQTNIAPATIPTESTSSGEGIFARIYRAMVEGQQIRAQRVVSRHLANLSDTQLTDLGFSPDEIKKTRQQGKVPFGYWS